MTGDVPNTVLVALLVCLSIIIGVLISTILLVGEKERLPILHLLDKLPGIVAAILTAVCCFSIYHITAEIWQFSAVADGAFVLGSAALSLHFGFKVHSKSARAPMPTVTTIGRRTHSNGHGA
jgi:hypothetical protein